ncbi:ABC transporter ATP-binding protein [Bordetella tumulicola]|uniref:ABC transporter ATP-binding protein n=1 Tax=Bordetella tumulicola TaxID=1649133 RepID=UPI0039F1420B
MSTDTIIKTEAVTRRFGGFTALKNVSIAFQSNKLTSIIGPNGAGKSTYFNILSGAMSPSEGRVIFDGQDLSGVKPHQFSHIGIAKSFQITNVFPNFTALGNVRMALQAHVSRYNLWKKQSALNLDDRAYAALKTVGIETHAYRPARELAHGQQRSLEIAIALASNPKLLLLDEPTAGMSPEETKSMMDLIVQLADTRTVILVEHKMKMIMGISDHIVVLHHGELLASGTPADIRSNDEVKRVYLGHH